MCCVVLCSVVRCYGGALVFSIYTEIERERREKLRVVLLVVAAVGQVVYCEDDNEPYNNES